MKVTSLKDMESYIYSTVILPLKALDVSPLRVSSPMTHEGRVCTFKVRREGISGNFAHAYQRTEAEGHAKWIVLISDGNSSSVIADYEERHHEVTLYKEGLDFWSTGLLKHKLTEAFGRYTPFTKVRCLDTGRGTNATVPEDATVADYPDIPDFLDREDEYDD